MVSKASWLVCSKIENYSKEAWLEWEHQRVDRKRLIFRMDLNRKICIVCKSICDIKLSLIVGAIL
jgi:hypothetical protein